MGKRKKWLETENRIKTFFSDCGGQRTKFTYTELTKNQECEKWQGKRIVWWKRTVAFIAGLGSGFNLCKTPFNKFALLR